MEIYIICSWISHGRMEKQNLEIEVEAKYPVAEWKR